MFFGKERKLTTNVEKTYINIQYMHQIYLEFTIYSVNKVAKNCHTECKADSRKSGVTSSWSVMRTHIVLKIINILKSKEHLLLYKK